MKSLDSSSDRMVSHENGSTIAPQVKEKLLTGKSLSGLLPFSKDILVLETYVAGLIYRKNINALLRRLKTGDRLILEREPDNEYDDLAIRVLNSSGKDLGYIPRVNNQVIARLMDSGKRFYAVAEKCICPPRKSRKKKDTGDTDDKSSEDIRDENVRPYLEISVWMEDLLGSNIFAKGSSKNSAEEGKTEDDEQQQSSKSDPEEELKKKHRIWERIMNSDLDDEAKDMIREIRKEEADIENFICDIVFKFVLRYGKYISPTWDREEMLSFIYEVLEYKDKNEEENEEEDDRVYNDYLNYIIGEDEYYRYITGYILTRFKAVLMKRGIIIREKSVKLSTRKKIDFLKYSVIIFCKELKADKQAESVRIVPLHL